MVLSKFGFNYYYPNDLMRANGAGIKLLFYLLIYEYFWSNSELFCLKIKIYYSLFTPD